MRAGRSYMLLPITFILALAVLLCGLAPPVHALAGPNSWSRLGGMSEDLDLLTFSPAVAFDKLALARWHTDVSDQGGLARSTNGGATWTKVGAGVEWVSDIEFSPAYSIDRTIYVRSSGQGPADDGEPTRPGCVWVSTDAGITWSRLADGDVGNVPAQGLGISPNGRTLVVPSAPSATEDEAQQIAVSLDAGSTWQRPFFGDSASYGEVARRGDSLVCVASGVGSAESVLLASDDGGRRWQLEAELSEGLSDWGTKLVFPTPSVGWAVSGGELRQSTDGGHTWGAPAADMSYSVDVAFGSASSGVAIQGGWSSGAYTKYTNDGGSTWTTSEPLPMEDGWTPVVAFFACDAPDEQNVWACGTVNWLPAILKSADGGASWARQTLPDAVSGGDEIFAIDMADASNGWALGGGVDLGTVVLRTTDGGGSWTVVYHDPTGDGGAGRVVAFDGLHCVVMSGDNPGLAQLLMTTIDGGVTWHKEPVGDSFVQSVAFNGSEGIATLVTDDGALMLRSSDGGLTWAPVLNRGVIGLSGIAVSPGFDVVPEVMAVGSKDNHGTFWRSVDGGWSWVSRSLPVAEPDWISLSRNYSADHTIFAGAVYWAANRSAVRSRDGGATWASLGVWAPVLQSPSGATSVALFAYKPNPKSRWCYSSGLQPVISNDGGSSWKSLGAPQHSYDVDDGVIPSPNWANDKTMYTIVRGDVWSYKLGAQRRAALSKPKVGRSRWDKRWVGWAIQISSKVSPAQPNGWAIGSLEFQKRGSRGWKAFTRVYPFKIDRHGKSKRVSPLRLYYSEILGTSTYNYGWQDYVLREKGTFRVRVKHKDSATTLGGDAASTSSWTTFTLKR